MNNKSQNNDKALFSLAMIDLKHYTDLIINLDKDLEEACYILHYIEENFDDKEDLLPILTNFSFKKFARVQKALKTIKKNIVKYQNRLEEFLNQNPKEYAEFYAQLDILIPLFEEKEKFIQSQIDKCFEFINKIADTHSV